jgi:hypothetical protein
MESAKLRPIENQNIFEFGTLQAIQSWDYENRKDVPPFEDIVCREVDEICDMKSVFDISKDQILKASFWSQCRKRALVIANPFVKTISVVTRVKGS